LGGRGRRGAAVVVGRRVEAVLLVVGRRDRWVGAGLRVVVGSQSRWVRGRGGLVTESFVVERLVTGAVLSIGGCGSGRVVAARSTHSARASGRGGTLETGCVGSRSDESWGTLETGCAGWLGGRVVCGCVSGCSGSGGVVV
jgi:hypothetical protein